MQKGFTLVELSIVLVIIGLLIGGILVGQSLIDSAKTQRAIRDLRQYDAAISLFKGRFRQLPGDSNRFGGIGDADGIINSGVFPAEFEYVWGEVSMGIGLKNSKGANYTVGNSVSNTNYPKFNIDQNTADNPFLKLYHIDAGDGNILTYEYRSSGAAPLKPITVMALDAKLDDGQPTTGKFTATSGEEDTAGICLNGANYNVQEKEYSCKFFIPASAL